MMLIEETGLLDGALPLVAFKAHLRLGSGFENDDVQNGLALSFLRAALATVEARTGKALLSRSFSWSVSQWRSPYAQDLPLAPVISVTRVALVARDGSESEIDEDGWWLERDMQRPRLRAAGSSLPGIPAGGAAKITFTAGFGPDWASLPGDLAQAVLMLAAHYYEYRGDTGLSDGCMPFGVSSLLERYRRVRMGFGA
ncbi:MAG: head-tail connector protein [Sulfitobacter sp.]|nr:head-tail connector protein [Sulfitobacter sp.]